MCHTCSGGPTDLSRSCCSVTPTRSSRPAPWHGDPSGLEDGKAYGPGVFDMKAGLVVALEALALVASRGPAAAVSGVAMLVTGDEEVGSQTSRALIEEVAAPAGAVLVLEPSLDGDLKVGRSGGSFYDLYFRGRAAHAGLEPETGRNALLEMARWALDLPGLADPAVGTSLTPTVAKAGTAINVVPGQALLRVDVRAALGDEQRRVDHAVRDRVATHNAVLGDGVGVDLEGGINRPPLEPELAAGLVRLCLEQAERIGQRAPGTAIVGGASDGNFTSALGVPTLDGLGPAGGGAHAAHEWVSIESFHDRIDLVAAVIEALLAPPG